MAGYTNGACRKIFREYGADGVVSEFVYSRAVLSGAGRVLEKLRIEDCERPVGIQIFGSDPYEMADAAVAVKDLLRPDFIDINFGCPAPNAVKSGAGSALLKNPPMMAKISRAMADAIGDLPLTAKMRTGWSSDSIVLPDAAKLLQDSGVRMLTVHGRTKAQGYEGDADWDLIELTARSLQIPVIGNGSAEKLSSSRLANSPCAGFMIGRAALGNPWIFSHIKARMENPSAVVGQPSASERARLALRYAELVASGGYSGISCENLTHARAQIMRFLKNAEGFKRLRAALKTVNSINELRELLCEYVRQ